MELIPVDPKNEQHLRFLYELLEARPAIAAVSHKKMPTWEEHCEFVRNHPYADWCLIQVVEGIDGRPRKGDFAGSVFLSQPARPSVVGDELSVDIVPHYRGASYAATALRMMMEKHGPRRYIANVSIRNFKSMALFDKLGFDPCQITFEISDRAGIVIDGKFKWRDN